VYQMCCKMLHILALSEVELFATVCNSDSKESSCIVEGIQKLPLVVANTPRKYDSELLKVPICVLNPSSQLVTLHKALR